MTAQATPSSNALGRRSLPSTFFAPLQGLGLHREPPKGDRLNAEDAVAPPTETPLEVQFDVQFEGWTERVQDDPAESPHQRATAGQGRDESLGRVWSLPPDRNIRFEASPEFALESSHDQHPDPDPRAVRGAISRLAREVQTREIRAQEVSARETQKSEAVHGNFSRPPVPREAAFAEVARRVWSESAAGTAPDGNPPDGNPRDGLQDTRRATTRGTSETVTATEDAVASVPVTGPFALDTRRDPLPCFQPDSIPHARPGSALDSTPGREAAHALAHDAGNLLSALRLYSELLCFSGVLHERHRHYAEDLKLLSQRSGRLIDRLLKLAEQVAAAEWSGSGASVPVGSPASFRVGPAVQANTSAIAPADRSSPFGFVPGGQAYDRFGAPETASLADVLMRLRGLLGTIAYRALTVDLGADAGTLVAVPAEALERILVNLVTNAAAAIRGGGAIRIRAGLIGDTFDAGGNSPTDAMARPTVVLTVDDSGCGMSEAQLRAALGQGASGSYAVHEGDNADDVGSRLVQPGVVTGWRHGRGLSIVRELVEAHGGRLFMHSREGTGTRIEIHWAAAANSVAGAGLPAFAPDSSRPSGTSLRRVDLEINQQVGRETGQEIGQEMAQASRWRPEFTPEVRFGPTSQLAAGAQFTPEAKGAVA